MIARYRALRWFLVLAPLAACSSTNEGPPPATPRRAETSPRILQVETVKLGDKAAPPAHAQAAPPTTVAPQSTAKDEAERENAVRTAILGEVEKHFGDMRECYFRGVDRDPKLAGRVTVRFVVAPSGEPVQVADEGSTLPDQQAIGCVLAEFTRMRFTPFEGKAVSVVFPVEFAMKR